MCATALGQIKQQTVGLTNVQETQEMTLIVGWLSDNAVILTADNMVSANRPIFDSGRTATGQPMSTYMGDVAFKLFRVNDHCVAAVSGNADIGVKFVSDLIKSEKLGTFEDFNESVKGIKDIGDSNTNLLIGFYDRTSNKSHLVKINTYEKTVHSGDYFALGSGKFLAGNNMDGFTKAFQIGMQGLSNATIADRIFMLSHTATLHLFGQFGKRMRDAGVGGVFFGVSVSEHGLIWQPKTLIIEIVPVPARNFVDMNFITIFTHEGVLFVASTLSGMNNMITNYENLSKEDASALKNNPNEWKLSKEKYFIDELNNVDAIKLFAIISNKPEHSFSGPYRKGLVLYEDGKQIISDKLLTMIKGINELSDDPDLFNKLINTLKE